MGKVSIYGQWVRGKPAASDSTVFAFDKADPSYDAFSVGATDAGQVISNNSGQREKCLVFCDSPGLTVSASDFRADIDNNYAKPLGRRSRVEYGETIAWINPERTRLSIAFPRYYEGTFFVECKVGDTMKKFGAVC